MNYKMIASDLDGTLLYDVFSVSAENMEAISEYTVKGGIVVPTTGRCYFEIPEQLRMSNDIRYIISSNGAVITDQKTGERECISISSERFDRLLDILEEYECYFNLAYRGHGYIAPEQDDAEVAASYHVNPYYFMHYHNKCEKPTDFHEFLRSGISPDMLSVFFRHQSELDICTERLKALGGLDITSSIDFNIEIIASGAKKGDAVSRLANRLGISKSEIIGIGDSQNDTTLLAATGLPLAVSNACDTLKKQANQVICSHTEHIIRYLLDHTIE